MSKERYGSLNRRTQMELTMNVYRGTANQSSTSTTTKNQRPPSLNNSQIYDSSALKSALNFSSTGTDFLKAVGKWHSY